MGAQTGMQAAMEANHRMLQQQIQSMADQMQLYKKNKSVLGKGLSAAQERGSTSQVRMQPAPNCEGNQHHNNYTPFPKVEFPNYDGDNTRTWIKKCNRDLPNWPEFTSAILDRFDDQDLELIVGEFKKLHQSGTVTDYLDSFEELKSHMLIFNKDLPEEFFSASFISGLREDIKGTMLSMRPHTFHQALSLAKKQESTVEAILKRATQSYKNTQNHKPNFKTPP
ncbi:hypothetical protein BUALT_Bualt06G0043500 [Buddleja alternifolia]|uniref:Retrotransposon gag domain-containing protein n=1 Tax=Buddleja alternifolia TaxID=168488 RepID=A0AAV6XE32_9LAMI|nr:hypothetical protein BUALT_Bualt06G0043500 [Buddleja alternifolia]